MLIPIPFNAKPWIHNISRNQGSDSGTIAVEAALADTQVVLTKIHFHISSANVLAPQKFIACTIQIVDTNALVGTYFQRRTLVGNMGTSSGDGAAESDELFGEFDSGIKLPVGLGLSMILTTTAFGSDTAYIDGTIEGYRTTGNAQTVTPVLE